MNLDYSNREPIYKKGWEHFYDPINPKFPANLIEKWASNPDLPKELMGESEFIGQLWEAVFTASVHEDITAVLTTEGKLKSTHYWWRKCTLNPVDMKPGVICDEPELQTMTWTYFQGTSSGHVGGLVMPPGFGSNKDYYEDMWNQQLGGLMDALVRLAQFGVYQRILNNPDQLILHIKRRGIPEKMNVAEFIERFRNPFVNIMKKTKGWYLMWSESDLLLDKYYPFHRKDTAQPWVLLISPETDRYVRTQKPENLFFLYSGPGETREKPEMSCKDYNNPKIMGNAVYVVPAFPDSVGSVLGRNILSKQVEFGRYYTMKPWNMLNKKNESLEGGYNDIKILNEKEQSDYLSQISYKKIIGIIAKHIPKFFECSTTYIPPNQNVQPPIPAGTGGSFYNLLVEMFKTATDNKTNWNDIPVKSPEDYVKYMWRILAEDTINRFDNYYKKHTVVFNSAQAAKIDAIFDPVLSDITKVADTFVDLFASTNQTRAQLLKIFYSSTKDWTFDASWKPAGGVAAVLNGNPEQLREIAIASTNVDNINLILGLFKILPLGGFVNFVEKLLAANIELPIGLHLHRIPIIESMCMVRVRRKCVNQISNDLKVSATQDHPKGEIRLNCHKEYAEIVMNEKHIQKMNDVQLVEAKYGGGTSIWDYNNKKFLKKEDIYEKGDIFVVPVALNEVVGPRKKMIDRTGFDPKVFERVVTDYKDAFSPKAQDKTYSYYSTWRYAVQLYKWDVDADNDNISEASYHFDSGIIERRTQAWAGYQVYCLNGGKNVIIEPELGPLKKNPKWWEEMIFKPGVKIQQETFM